MTRSAALLTLGRMPPFVSTSAVVVDEDRILVVVDPVRSETILPGGHLRWRETPPDALLREVREETGYLIRPERLIGVLAGAEASGEPGVVRIIYEGSISGGALASSSEGEACWMTIGDLAASDTRDAPIVRRWLEQQAARGYAV